LRILGWVDLYARTANSVAGMGGLKRSAGGTVAAPASTPANEPRYELFGEIASGGMASVRYGRRIGPLGFARAVAVKRLHAQFANNPDFVSMFIDEARLSARLVHANIVATLDVLLAPGEISLVMEYVHGESLGVLLEKAREFGEVVPVRVAVSLMASVLHGLHAAHEATDDLHSPLHVVHRDVSPQNILVGVDGVPRMIDFGIARALGHMRSTPSGEIKGKLAYISPEQLSGGEVDRRADVYGASVVLWETLVGRMLFDADSESALVHRVLHGQVPSPSAATPSVPRALDEIVLRGLARDSKQRFATALDMAIALERAVAPATQAEVARWLDRLVGDKLRNRARALTLMQEGPPPEQAPAVTRPRASSPETRKIELASSQPGWPKVPERPAALPVPPPALEEPVVNDGRPSSEIRLRGRQSAVRGLVAGLLIAAAAVAALAWSQLRTVEEPHGVPLVKPAPEEPLPAAEVEMQEPAAVEPAAVEPAAVEPVDQVPAPAEPVEPESEAVPDAPAGKRTGVRAKRTQMRNVDKGKPASQVQSVTPAKPNCDPYYYIDHEGIRRPKPECL
jgi:serine/threonine protein kinase